MKITKARLIFIFLTLMAAILPASVLVLGELTHEHILLPGESIAGVIEVMNQAGVAQQVRIYQTDYNYSADGTSQYGTAGEMVRSNANWIEISPKQFVVPPNERAIVNYNVRVPEERVNGSYWSMVMIEPVQEMPTDQSEEMLQIRTVIRYGVQLITHIGNSGIKSVRFQNTEVVRDSSSRHLQIELENDGERLVRPNIWIEVYNSEGQFVGKFEAKQGKLVPGASIRRQIDISQLNGGEYKTLIIADCGGDDIFGLNLTLNVQDIPIKTKDESDQL